MFCDSDTISCISVVTLLYFATFDYIVDMSDRSPNNFSANFAALNDISAPQRENGGAPSRQSSVNSPSRACYCVVNWSFLQFQKMSQLTELLRHVRRTLHLLRFKKNMRHLYSHQLKHLWMTTKLIWKGTSVIIILGLPPVSSTDLSVT